MSRPRPPRRPGAEAPAPGEVVLDAAHLPVQDELESKRAAVERALGAVGIAWPIPLPEASPRREGARARIDLRVDRAGCLVVHRPGSHDPLPAPVEAMAHPTAAAAARAIERCLVAAPDLGVARLAVRTDGARAVAVAAPGPARAETVLATLGPALGTADALCLGARALAGDPRLAIDLGGLALVVGPLTFFQVNLEVNRQLVATVAEAVMAFRPTRVLDLFGGAGNLSLPLAARGVPVELIESSPGAAADARANAARLGLPVEVRTEDACRLQPGSRFFDVAVLDPPRRGAGSALEAVLVTRPRGIVLVSCHPLAFARDLRAAARRGYSLAAVRLFDMFPLTTHCESVAVLERG